MTLLFSVSNHHWDNSSHNGDSDTRSILVKWRGVEQSEAFGTDTRMGLWGQISVLLEGHPKGRTKFDVDSNVSKIEMDWFVSADDPDPHMPLCGMSRIAAFHGRIGPVNATNFLMGVPIHKTLPQEKTLAGRPSAGKTISTF